MNVDVILSNARIPQGDHLVKVNVLIKDGKIAGYVNSLEDIQAKTVIDAEDNLVLPGCIDSHVHFMDPGFTHREDFATGTQAAAAGGVTTVIDMPCCSVPSVRTVEAMQNKIEAIRDKAYVDFALWGGVTGEDVRNGELHHVYEQMDAGVVGFKVYMTPSVPTYPKVSDAEMLEIFHEVAKTGLPLGVHTENFNLCDFYTKKLQSENRLDGPAWAEARLELAEKTAIELCISFAEHTGARMHVVHMSTGVGGLLIGEAKKRGLDVTAETCPHYLLLNAKDAMSKWGSFAKIAPPLRTEKDNEMLWQQLQNGYVDFVATDHAPYEIATEKEKEGMNIWNSFPGIPGVETMVPIIISEGYNKGRISLSRLVEILSTNPAKHYGLYPKKGSLEIGADADFTVVDLEREWVIKAEEMYSKAKYTPFDGFKLKGKPVKTIVRGQLVYDDGIVGKPGYGVFVKRQNISKLERWIQY